jgi:hypothetical protein
MIAGNSILRWRSVPDRRAAALAFAPEWCALAALVLVDIVWALLIGLRFEGLHARLALIPAGMALLVLLRSGYFEGAARTCEYIFLSFAGSLALVVLSYLCLASAGPLMDDRFVAFDRALGFDWLAIRQWLDAHPPLPAIMRTLYASLFLQGFVCTLLMCLRGNLKQMRELWLLSTLGCILCCLVAMTLPALGPFKLFHYEAEAVFMADLEKLVAGRDLRFQLETVTGVITFPSFHTVLALTIPYALRRHGAGNGEMDRKTV